MVPTLTKSVIFSISNVGRRFTTLKDIDIRNRVIQLNPFAIQLELYLVFEHI